MNRKFRSAMSVATLAAGALMFSGIAEAAPAGVKVGVLTCNVANGWGLVFGSSRSLRCDYAPQAGYDEHYVGAISKFGVDLGYTGAGVIMWGVVAPTADLVPGTLAGSYVGVTGGATVGVGGDANVLIGGSGNSISLQPLSIEGNSGLNVAAGIAAISLQYQAPPAIGALPTEPPPPPLR